MIPIIGLIAGFVFGWVRATKREGNQLDKLQYAVGHAIAFGLLALFLGILAARFGLI